MAQLYRLDGNLGKLVCVYHSVLFIGVAVIRRRDLGWNKSSCLFCCASSCSRTPEEKKTMRLAASRRPLTPCQAVSISADCRCANSTFSSFLTFFFFKSSAVFFVFFNFRIFHWGAPLSFPLRLFPLTKRQKFGLTRSVKPSELYLVIFNLPSLKPEFCYWQDLLFPEDCSLN